MAEPGVLELEDGTVDLRRGEVVRDGVTVALTTRERELLAFLSERADGVVRRDDAHHAVWGMNARVVSRAIDNTVTRLRGKIERDPSAPRHLLTIYGVGYQWVARGRTRTGPSWGARRSSTSCGAGSRTARGTSTSAGPVGWARPG